MNVETRAVSRSFQTLCTNLANILPEERRRNCSCGIIGTTDYWTYKTIGFSKTGIVATKDFNLTQERLHGRMVVVKKPVVDALIKEGIVGIQYIPVDVL